MHIIVGGVLLCLPYRVRVLCSTRRLGLFLARVGLRACFTCCMSACVRSCGSIL